MSRLIDADKAINGFPIRYLHCDMEHGNEHFIYGIETVMEYIDNMAEEQKVEYAPVIHAHWISIKGAFHIAKCSHCEYVAIDAGKYCPECGARMDEEV